jgi:hypothetical protein
MRITTLNLELPLEQKIRRAMTQMTLISPRATTKE